MFCIVEVFVDDLQKVPCGSEVELCSVPRHGKFIGIDQSIPGLLRVMYDDGKSLTDYSMSVLECDRQPRPQERTMDQRQRQDLDRYITGNYGEDQFKREHERDKDAAPVPAALSLLTDAIETCPYLGDWAEVTGVVRNEDHDVQGFLCREVVTSDNDSTGPWVEVNPTKVREAARKLITGEVSIGRGTASQFIGKEEDWEYDGIGVDAIIQVIVLGEVKYG